MNEAMNQEATPEINANSNFPLGLIRGLRNGMNNGGSGNNSGDSDNSGSLSIGNNSFGFNFDSDEMNKIGAAPIGPGLSASEAKNNSNAKNFDECADENASSEKKNVSLLTTSKLERANADTREGSPKVEMEPLQTVSSSMEKPEVGPKQVSSSAQREFQGRDEQSDNNQVGFTLNSVDMKISTLASSGSSQKLIEPPQQKSSTATSSENRVKFSSSCQTASAPNQGIKVDTLIKAPGAQNSQNPVASAAVKISSTKRSHSNTKTMDEGELGSEAGYNSDDEATELANKGDPKQTMSGEKSNRRQKRASEGSKREERNAREKDRSLRISQQIDELRSLLSSGGVIVPKGTKSSVLTEASNYIRMLQQHQYRSEIDRHQLVQQIQMIGSGALGPQAADAVRHAAAQNGVWCLGNFGGVPPQSAMTHAQKVAPVQEGNIAATTTQQPVDVRQIKKVEEQDYRHLFSSSSIAMAIASMGGAFIDCNKIFCQLSAYSKQELCSMTIFNLTAKSDLQSAFDRISSMIAPPPSGRQEQTSSPPILLRGAMKEREDLGLNISLVRGDDGVLKCFCVTLVKDIPPAFSSGRPTVASFESLKQSFASSGQIEVAQKSGVPEDTVTSPAYTAG